MLMNIILISAQAELMLSKGDEAVKAAAGRDSFLEAVEI